MSTSVLGAQPGGSTLLGQWYYDAKRNRMFLPESEEQARLRAQRQAKSKAEKKEREELNRKRRARERQEEAQRLERRRVQYRADELQGRIKQLTSKIMANQHDDKARAELSYARTQLFWVNNLPAP